MVAMLGALLIGSGGQVNISRTATEVVVTNRESILRLDLQTGYFSLGLAGKASIEGAFSEVRLSDGSDLKTSEYATHTVSATDIVSARDVLGRGYRISEHSRKPGSPEIVQEFFVSGDRPEIVVRVSAKSSDKISTNYMAPVMTHEPIKFEHKGPLNSLFVPYDNDSYFRYSSSGWDESDGSHEIGAAYDDETGYGLVAGSIDHDQWKSGIKFTKGENQEVAGFTAFAGESGKDTHDSQPHGFVSGLDVASPRFVFGWYPNWRGGLERIGDLNGLVQPDLPWHAEIPFGWNSWSGHKDKVTYKDADAATDFIANRLPWFRSGGTAYINLDSFWDNLTPAQLRAFSDKAHKLGLKAGIYYTPFVGWGNLSDRVEGTHYTYQDLVLKGDSGKPLPKLDGGWPLDPTHPGEITRVDNEMAMFVRQGFDYVKLDFLTHGALEGKHYDPKVTTGTEAYRVGMQRIDDDLSFDKTHRHIFIGLSIAPMFPSGYAQARRVSCDVFANIGATEYFLNSANYGWWMASRLYKYNDPDSSCVCQPLGEPPVTEAESRSRFTASVIGGGFMIEGDDLTSPKACERVESIFSNRKLLEIARLGKPFLPVSGTTGSKAGDAFYRIERGGKSCVLAFFNFDKGTTVSKRLNLGRLGLKGESWKSEDLWSGVQGKTGSEVSVSVPPMDCVVLKLDR